MQTTNSAAILIKIAIDQQPTETVTVSTRSDSNINILSNSSNYSSNKSSNLILNEPYQSQVTINLNDPSRNELLAIESTITKLINVKPILKITDSIESKHYRILASKLTVTEFIKHSKNYVRVNDWNFPDYCDNQEECSGDELNRLIDPVDQYIQVGSSIVYVNYGKYYDKIFQFDEKFVALLGTSFRATGLSESLFFDETTYTLKGDIPFTEPKTITFIINEIYKYTLILKVDVHECFVE